MMISDLITTVSRQIAEGLADARAAGVDVREATNIEIEPGITDDTNVTRLVIPRIRVLRGRKGMRR